MDKKFSRLIVFMMFFVLISGCPLIGQVPQGFNYQAVALDNSGMPLKDKTIKVKLSVLTDTTGFYSGTGGTYLWEEEHVNVRTNSSGVFTVVLGSPQAIKVQGSAASFSSIDWSLPALFIGTKIANPDTYKVMGTSRFWSVPYSMLADGLSGSVKRLTISGETANLEEPLFEVKNKNGQTVFAVYNEGIRAYVGDGESKGKKGGFAIGSFDPAKGEQDLFIVTADSIRAYIYDDPLTKGKKGGFAIGGFDGSKGITNDYLIISPDSVRVYIDHSSGKGVKGGFAIGSFDPSKGLGQEYLVVSRDSVRVYIDEQIKKGVKGGFAIGGFDSGKAGKSTFLDVSPNTSDIILSENRILWYPVKNAFLTGRVKIEHPDSVGVNSFASGFESKAKGQYSQALGYQAIARADYSTAIGKNAVAHKPYSFAFGDNVYANGINSYAFGQGTITAGTGSFAVGTILDGIKTQALKDNSIAMGLGCVSSGTGAVSIGTKNTSSADYSFSAGKNSSATKIGATAIGQGVNAAGEYSTAMGYSTNASGNYSTTLGYSTSASGNYSTALGYTSSATGQYSTALGTGSTATGDYSIAIGHGSMTKNNRANSTAIGYSCVTESRESFAAGRSATAGNSGLVYGYAYAIGYFANATGGESLCFGVNSTASGFGSISVGNNATASGEYSISVGRNPSATGNYATALGYRANAQSYLSTVIGYGTAPGNATGWVDTDPLFVVGNGLNSPSNAFTILKNANVGIGRTPAVNRLEVEGNASKTTAGDWLANSDARIKTDISEIENARDILMRLHPVKFRYTDYWKRLHPVVEDHYYYNFIAQEYGEVFPEAVKSSNEYLENDSNPLLQIDTHNAEIITIKAVQELIKENEELRSEILQLKERLSRLETEKDKN